MASANGLSVDGINYSVNIKKVKGNEYYVVNFRNSQGKVVEKSTGMKPNKDTLRQAEKRAKEIVSEYAKQNISSKQVDSDDEDEDGILLSDFIVDWVNLQKPQLRATTYDNYISMLNCHIIPYFKDSKLKLADVKPMHLKGYINETLTKVSPNTVRKHFSLIKTAMQEAFINDLIVSNPADKVKQPKKVKPQYEFYTEKELETLLKVIKGTELEVPVYIATLFGLRRSEVIGLRWSSIDFNNKTLTINGSVTRQHINGKWVNVYSSKLKTDASYSTYELNDAVCSYFKKLYEHNMQLISNVDDYKDFICVNAIGERMKPDYVTAKFSELLEDNELKHIRFQDLRHSALTLLSKKYSPKVLQGYARHACCSTTTDIYCHSDINDTLMELDTICTALNFGE